jgi:hypothetical protein
MRSLSFCTTSSTRLVGMMCVVTFDAPCCGTSNSRLTWATHAAAP